MTAVLLPADVLILRQALALVQAGDAAAGEQLVRGMRAAARQHHDALFVLAMALRRQQRFGEARAVFEAALVIVPQHHQIWNAFGNMLGEMGEAGPAVAALQNAVAAAPGYAEGWINLGIAATAAGLLDVAAGALQRAAVLAPGDGRVAAASGSLALALGRPEPAIAACRQALAANPRDHRSRHNLATALRTLDRRDEALAELDRALAEGSTLVETATVRAHVLAELGRFEAAIAQYRAVLQTAPEHLDAQETLARLLPQVGRGDEALDGYHTALRSGGSRALWLSAIAAAQAIGDSGTVLDWVGRAEGRYGEAADLALARVGALAGRGDRGRALALAADAARRFAGIPAIHSWLAHLHLQGGDARTAEGHALQATALNRFDQAAWALLTVIWRLLDDPRESWLADYDRLVMPAILPVPTGWSSLAQFLGDVRAILERLHITTMAPAEQSLRGGTQTRGNLFDRNDPVLAALMAAVREVAARSLGALPHDAGHPFLGRNSGSVRLAGSWSVRLRSQGFHVCHVHTEGWLSSALYIDVPPEIGAEASGDAGRLLFGRPDGALGLDLPPRRVETPEPGKLVLFPSYLWHGTAPFDSATARLTVAFDALPG